MMPQKCSDIWSVGGFLDYVLKMIGQLSDAYESLLYLLSERVVRVCKGRCFLPS